MASEGKPADIPATSTTPDGDGTKTPGTDSGKEEFKPFSEDSKTVFKIIAVVAVMLLIIMVTMYLVNMIKSNSLKQMPLLTTVLALDNRQMLPFVVPSASMSAPSRGQEYSFNFWIYLADTYDATTEHKVVFQRGTSVGLNGTALPTTFSSRTGPMVVMDKASNRMMFAVNTSFVNKEMSLDQIFAQDPVTKRYNGPYLCTAIEYIPLQRWVNVTMAVRDNAMAIYMDGDLYSIVTTNDVLQNQKTPFLRMPTGDVTIGNSVNNVRGFMSKFMFFNYSLTQGTITKMYNAGPSNTTFLSWFGLSRYGLRSPVYELDA